MRLHIGTRANRFRKGTTACQIGIDVYFENVGGPSLTLLGYINYEFANDSYDDFLRDVTEGYPRWLNSLSRRPCGRFRKCPAWVDGKYVGDLKELKGSKKVLLLPGEHVTTVRQDGYQDFTERIRSKRGICREAES